MVRAWRRKQDEGGEKWGKGYEVARGRNLSQHGNTEVHFDALSVSCPVMSLASSLLFLF